MLRRKFLVTWSVLWAAQPASAHSPWGQYVVYRQKHLLVLSTRDDVQSYPYSKRLVEAINKGAPKASARPARAPNLTRAYDLLRTDQFQFALLSTAHIDAMRSSSGAFSGRPSIDLRTVYKFNDLEFVVRADFPPNLVSIVADAVLSNIELLPGAVSPSDILKLSTVHPGARAAIEHP